MRSPFVTLIAGTAVLLLSGCPDVPGARVPLQSASHESASHAAQDSQSHDAGVHHSVSEIAWFQGTIDEAFSRRGCSESHPRHTLFRF